MPLLPGLLRRFSLWRKNYSWEAFFLEPLLELEVEGWSSTRNRAQPQLRLAWTQFWEFLGLSLTFSCSRAIGGPTWHGRWDTRGRTSCPVERSGTRWRSRCSRQSRLPGRGKRIFKTTSISLFSHQLLSTHHLRVFAVCYISSILLPSSWKESSCFEKI